MAVTYAQLANLATALGVAHQELSAMSFSDAPPTMQQPGPQAEAEAAISLGPILKVLIPLLPLLKPVLKQLVLDNLDPALDALFKALADAASKA